MGILDFLILYAQKHFAMENLNYRGVNFSLFSHIFFHIRVKDLYIREKASPTRSSLRRIDFCYSVLPAYHVVLKYNTLRNGLQNLASFQNWLEEV